MATLTRSHHGRSDTQGLTVPATLGLTMAALKLNTGQVDWVWSYKTTLLYFRSTRIMLLCPSNRGLVSKIVSKVSARPNDNAPEMDKVVYCRNASGTSVCVVGA